MVRLFGWTVVVIGPATFNRFEMGARPWCDHDDYGLAWKTTGGTLGCR